ncbi:NlpC/P60 family protein [Streptomyces sp. NPDC058475]|uniref:C40 family peptidase n=1 Tax=unclassified Streptomyces TaxID=2593676 RepID=UPI0036633ADE
MKKGITAAALVIAAVLMAACGLMMSAVADEGSDTGPISGKGGLKGVPEEFRTWILRATKECKYPELSPALLAAQLHQESGFSTRRSTVSRTGAQGPAQFMPGTWATWGRDADGNGTADPFDVGDAVMAQGRMMCSLIGQARRSGFTADVRALALAGYNAGWGAVEQYRGIPPYQETENYVRIILASMKQYEASDSSLTVTGSGTGPDALRKALTELGTPYAYGGGGPNGPSTGFCDGTSGYLADHCVASSTVGYDCSSLVQYAYWPDLKLPRTAAAQYSATSDRPVARADLHPGDLLFWSHRGGAIYHVAIYAGDGKIVQAPRTGKNVEVVALSSAMPASDYYGATRP